jgi:hypothetical protein
VDIGKGWKYKCPSKNCVEIKKILSDIFNKEQIWLIKEYEVNKYVNGNDRNNFIRKMQYFGFYERYKLKQL